MKHFTHASLKQLKTVLREITVCSFVCVCVCVCEENMLYKE